MSVTLATSSVRARDLEIYVLDCLQLRWKQSHLREAKGWLGTPDSDALDFQLADAQLRVGSAELDRVRYDPFKSRTSFSCSQNSFVVCVYVRTPSRA
jgi:hypothetical protein